MTLVNFKGPTKARRRLRLGMVGGGEGGFIGAIHRMAARLDDRYEFVAGALSSDPDRARPSALDLGIAPDRAYGSFAEMARQEKRQADKIDVVAIVTPNNAHVAPAKAFLAAGIHVICDKPLATTLKEALSLAAAVERSGLVFGLTHNYTGHPMVRQAREMVAAKQLGRLRIIQVEYPQDWLTTPLERKGNKQAAWRTDPKRSGRAGSLGDIGTHAYNLARFVSGLDCEAVAADLSTFVPGRRVDDNVQMLMRFAGGVRGMLWASQVAVGNENNLKLRVYGEKAGLEWRQEDPNYLWFTRYGETPRRISRAGAGASRAAAYAARFPAGLPEGYIEAFAQLYTDLAEQISARLERRRCDPAARLVPGIAEGVEGMRFVEAALASARRNAAWVKIAG
jgi:predicted dehydrogenase